MWKTDIPSSLSSNKPALVQFGHDLWNKLTGKYEYARTPIEKNVSKERRTVLQQSSTERRTLLHRQSINIYRAWERLSPEETAQKIQNIFGNVESVRIPRSSWSIEVAIRGENGLFYFSGKNTPCYLDKGETVSKNLDVKESKVRAVQSKVWRRVDSLLPKVVPSVNPAEIPLSKAPSLPYIQSAPFEKNPDTWTTLCSKTARLNLAKLLWWAKVPTWDAKSVYQNYPRYIPGMVWVYQRWRPDFHPPENANVADVFIDAGGAYGHRAVAYVNNGKWYVLDPYFYNKNEKVIPKPAEEYFSFMKTAGRPIGWIAYFRKEVQVA